jgi:hypothetical protein
LLSVEVGGSGSNGYCSQIEAQAFIDLSLSSENIELWNLASSGVKDSALFSAAERLDREFFFGQRTYSTQALAWPRSFVLDPDSRYSRTSNNIAATGLSSYLPSDTIPPQVKKAQIALALYLNANPEYLEPQGLDPYKRVKIGVLEVEPMQPQNIRMLPPTVEHYLAGLKRSASSLARPRG